MMRPERTKRPRTAADGTVLSATPVQKKAKLNDGTTPKLTPQNSSKKEVYKKKAPKSVSPIEASDDEFEESASVEPSASHLTGTTSTLSSLSESNLKQYLPDARNRVLSVLTGQLPPPSLDERGRHDGLECIGLQDQWLNLRAAIKGTLQGEGNSVLLVGSKGCGKSLVSGCTSLHFRVVPLITYLYPDSSSTLCCDQ